MTKVMISLSNDAPAIRLPQAELDKLGLKAGDVVDFVVRDGRGMIETARPKLAPSLADIVAEIRRLGPENEPPTVDWGPDVGSERFYDHE
ncbi:antitoxin MazE [Rhizobium sp. RU20A]|uniref:AbrB/MazE/SpoVT family DNA-binding domain-containing protein n=1 Tax=Rhizobium sp. RU20A TaxID=1907412 RepID=UPI0009572011|nr:MazF family transcriptional regulator [Rhizobium sp. RU20A]SIQ17970.1 antitoxin MazE [Rhizobium sp. RU20A]